MIKNITSSTLKKFNELSLDDLKEIRVKSFSKREKKVEECVKAYQHLYMRHYLLEDKNVSSRAYNPVFLNILEKFIAKAENANFPYIAKECGDSSDALAPLYALNEDLNKPDLSSVYIGVKKETADKMLSKILDQCSNHFFNNHDLTELRKRNLRELLYTGNCFYQLEEINEKNKITLIWKHIKITEIAIEKEFNEIIYFFREVNFSYNECEKYFGKNKYAMQRIKDKYTTQSEEKNRNDKGIKIYETVCRCPETGECLIKYDLDDTNYGFLEEEPRYRDYPVFSCQQINCIGDELYGSPDEWLYQSLERLEEYQIQYFNFVKKILGNITNPEIYNVFKKVQIETTFEDGVNSQKDAMRKNAELNQERNLDIETVQLFGGNLQNQISTPDAMLQSYKIIREYIQDQAESFSKTLLTPVEALSFMSQQDRRIDLSVFELKTQQALNTDRIMLNIQEVETSNKLKIYVEYTIKKMVQLVKEHIQTNYQQTDLEIEEYINLINLDPVKELEEMFEAIFDAKVNLNFNANQLNKHPFKILLEEQRILQVKSIINELEEQFMVSEDELEKLEFQKQLNNAYFILNALKKEFKSLLESAKMSVIEMKKSSLVHSFNEDQIMFFFSFAKFNKKIKYQLASPEANMMRSIKIRNRNAFRERIFSYLQIIAQANPEEAKRLIIALDLGAKLREEGEDLGLDVMITDKEVDKKVEIQRQQELEAQIQLIQAQQQQVSNQ